MRAAKVIKRNGRELQEHRHLGCANGKKEEPTKVEKEWGEAGEWCLMASEGTETREEGTWEEGGGDLGSSYLQKVREREKERARGHGLIKAQRTFKEVFQVPKT